MAEAIAPAKNQNASVNVDAPNEVIVDGKKNIWICELGRREDDGNFAEFIEKICEAEIHFNGLAVRYQSPSQGWLEFAWTGPLKNSGQLVPLDDYPRYDNPYCQADFLTEQILIQTKNHDLILDWQNLIRQID